MLDNKSKQLSLLEAINNAQEYFIGENNNENELYDFFLENFLALTDSQYGFIGKVSFRVDDPYVKILSISDFEWEDGNANNHHIVPQSLEFHDLNTLYGAALVEKDIIISNAPSEDPRGRSLPKGYPELKSFLGIPLIYKEKLLGLIVIGNKPEGYNENTVSFVLPFINTCTTLIAAYNYQVQNKKNKKRLRQSEGYFKEVQKTAKLGSFNHYTDEHELSWSDELFYLFGFEPHSVVPTDELFFYMIHEDDKNWCRKKIDKSLETGEDIDLNFKFIRADNKLCYMHMLAKTIRDSDDKIIGHSGIIQDITKSKEAENKLITIQGELQKQNNRLAIINMLSKALFQNLDLMSIAELSVSEVQKHYNLNTATIYLVNRNQKQLDLLYEQGVEISKIPSLKKLSISDSFEGSAVIEQKIIININPARDDIFSMEARELFMETKTRLLTVIPLIARNRAFGVLTFTLTSFRNFNNEDKQMLMLIGNTIGIALSNLEYVDRIKSEINERIKTEQKLIQSENKLKQSLSAAKAGSWSWNMITDKIVWSDEMYELFGLKRESFTPNYEDWLALIYPDDIEWVEKEFKAAVENRKKFDLEFRIIRQEDQVIWMRSIGNPTIDANNNILSLTGINLDITQSKQVQERFRLIFESSPIAFILTDKIGTIRMFNKQAETFFQHSRKEILGKNIDILIPKEIKKLQKRFYKKIINEETSFDKEINALKKDGSKFPVSIRLNNIKIEDEILVLNTISDLSEITKKNNDLIKLTKELVQKNKNLEDFSYIISHNLRMPVANILGLTDIFNHENPLDEFNAPIIEHLRNSSLKLDDIISDLGEILDLRNLKDEKREKVSFNNILKIVKLSLRSQIDAKHAKITHDFKNAPYIYTVKSYLQSILKNLLSNAIKYHQHDITPEINIKTEKKEGYICLSVSDKGLGIDLTMQREKVFGLYKRFHTHIEGKGLGLHIVRTQAETLGGKVEVDSEVNKGSTFKIYFKD